MWTRFKSFIYPPSNDPDEMRRRQIVSVLSRGLLGLSLFALVAISIFLFLTPDRWLQPGNQLTVISAGVAIVFSLFIYQVNKRSSRISSFLLLTLLTLISIFSDTPEQLSNGRSLFIFTLPIAVSSLIFLPASSFFFAAINSVIVSILANQVNLVPNITAIIGFFMLAFISWLSARSLEQAIRDLRVTNTNLDNIVTERTHELSDALSREKIESGRNQAILNSIADGVIVFDANNSAILANPALSSLIESPVQNLIGNQLDDFINAEQLSPSSREMMSKLISNPDQSVSGLRIQWENKTLSTSFALVKDETNSNIGTVAVFRDISREAEIEKLKESFVAMISHELRTPINAIMGHAEMLKEAVYGALNEKQASVAGRIMVNSERLLGMVGDLLDEAQISAGKLSIKPQLFKTAALIESLHNVMDKIAADKGLYLTDEIDSNMPEEIKGDPQRLQQVLINLVNNAVKFTEKGGIHVRVLRPTTDQWSMEIIDTGIGIPEEETPSIFEAFRQIDPVNTRQRGGFGLGLSIVKQLIELMNGEIKVQSKVASGSKFTVILPLEVN